MEVSDHGPDGVDVVIQCRADVGEAHGLILTGRLGRARRRSLPVRVAELDADPWAGGPALGHAVLPGALAGPAHHEQIAGSGQEADSGSTLGGPQPERTHGSK